jgi:excisionase family DNA binding protein
MSTTVQDEVDEEAVVRQLRSFGLVRGAAVSIVQTGELLGVKASTTYKLIDRGELPSFFIGGSRKIGVIDIIKYMLKQRGQPPKKRAVAWDRNGLARRQFHPRRPNTPVAKSNAERDTR